MNKTILFFALVHCLAFADDEFPYPFLYRRHAQGGYVKNEKSWDQMTQIFLGRKDENSALKDLPVEIIQEILMYELMIISAELAKP